MAETVKEIIEDLKNRDRDVRALAAKALGEIKDKSAVPALIGALKDKDSKVRAEAATALGVMRDKLSAFKPLIDAVFIEKNKDARNQMYNALDKILNTDVPRDLHVMRLEKRREWLANATGRPLAIH